MRWEPNGVFWTCSQDGSSSEHIHNFDEYMIVVQGCYTLFINGERIIVGPGEECLIPHGVSHSGEVKAGTRTIHAFGGHRADRVPSRQAHQSRTHLHFKKSAPLER